MIASTKYSKPEPELSIIVCHHVGDLLFGFLDSIFQSTNVTFEVIVVTSSSELATQGIKDCRVFHSNELPAAKRNIGSRVARGKYLAFFDDDVEVSPDCLWELRQAMDIGVGMVYGKLWNMEHRTRFDEAGGFLTTTGFIWSRAQQNDIDTGQFDKVESILAGKSASCMVRSDIFKQVGGFDEDFGILGEETDLSWRIWLQGKSVLFVPSATGYHAFNTKFKPTEKHYTSHRVQYMGCRNYTTMLIKNLGRQHLWIVPIHMTIWFTAGLAMIITGKIRQGANILKGLWHVIIGSGKTLEKRTLIQRERKVDESALWAIISRRSPRGYYTQRFTRYITHALHG